MDIRSIVWTLVGVSMYSSEHIEIMKVKLFTEHLESLQECTVDNNLLVPTLLR